MYTEPSGNWRKYRWLRIRCTTPSHFLRNCSSFCNRYTKPLYTGWAKSHFTGVKIEYLENGSTKHGHFFTKDKGIFTLQIHMRKVAENLS